MRPSGSRGSTRGFGRTTPTTPPLGSIPLSSSVTLWRGATLWALIHRLSPLTKPLLVRRHGPGDGRAGRRGPFEPAGLRLGALQILVDPKEVLDLFQVVLGNIPQLV